MRKIKAISFNIASLFLVLALIACGSIEINAQELPTATIEGQVTDVATGNVLAYVAVHSDVNKQTVETDSKGLYRIIVPVKTDLTIVFSRLGYQEVKIPVEALKAGAMKRIDVELAPVGSELEVVVVKKDAMERGMIVERAESMKYLPAISGNIESALPYIALGASSGTGGELSSQYNVRGGNYDENLVYLNGFKIYRPQLVRQGQQEGLSLPNPDLISTLSFSSGGFEARYGDKLSSVLDIHYKRPDSLKASADASLLGGSVHVEGSIDKKQENQDFQYLIGARYKTTTYLLNSLDIKGEYLPTFIDIQSFLRYDLNENWEVDLLLNYNKSSYQFEPVSQATSFGMINYNLKLTTAFDGREADDFTTRLAGLSFTYVPDKSKNYFLRFYSSYQDSHEKVAYDIIGAYRLSQIEMDLENNVEKEVGVLGNGVQHRYARNFLNFAIIRSGHKGGYELETCSNSSHFIQWGVAAEYQTFVGRLNEWERIDSALYSLPYDEEHLYLNKVYKSTNSPQATILTSYIQDTWSQLTQMLDVNLTAGIRANYRTLNDELLLSPRAQVILKPVLWERDMTFKFSTGLYAQQPFYREMQRPDGSLNTALEAQKSAHVVLGWTYDFRMGDAFPRQFRLIAEAYYKKLWDLVSYDIDNVRIRYSGKNDAVGHVMGLDLRLNGEFVPGAESWINLSFLRARERLLGVQHKVREIGSTEGTNVKNVPRPTDQLFNLSMFFQDYMPGNENLRAHVQFTIATGLPYGLRGSNRVYRNTYRYDLYHRMDVGFSYLLWDEDMLKEKPMHPLRFMRRVWIGLEVYNLMDKENEVSNTWIKTVFKRYYRVPNYLTSRRFNVRLMVEF